MPPPSANGGTGLKCISRLESVWVSLSRQWGPELTTESTWETIRENFMKRFVGSSVSRLLTELRWRWIQCRNGKRAEGNRIIRPRTGKRVGGGKGAMDSRGALRQSSSILEKK